MNNYHDNRLLSGTTQQPYSCCSCVCCPLFCSCYCIGDDRGCTCHLDPNISFDEYEIFTQIKGEKVPYTQLAQFFNHIFPGQIGVISAYLDKILTYDYYNVPVRNVIILLGLVPLKEQLISRDIDKKKYCCKTYYRDIDADILLKEHNYKAYPDFARGRCVAYMIEDMGNDYDFGEGYCQ